MRHPIRSYFVTRRDLDLGATTETLTSGGGRPERSASSDSDDGTILEQYKLYVEMADRVSARRAAANTFFLTINTAVFTLIGVLWTKRPEAGTWVLAFPLAVLVMQCLTWFWVIRSYRQLNTAKFAVIGALETLLPVSPYWRGGVDRVGKRRRSGQVLADGTDRGGRADVVRDHVHRRFRRRRDRLTRRARSSAVGQGVWPSARRSITKQILISSPSDVDDLAAAVIDGIHDWNATTGAVIGHRFEPRRWHRDAPRVITDEPQATIDGIVRSSDAAIVVFWHRLGTPTNEHPSGTAAEIDAFRANGRPVVVLHYRRDLPEDVDLEQVRALREYLSTHVKLKRGFKTKDELRLAVDQQLHHLDELLFGDAEPGAPQVPNAGGGPHVAAAPAAEIVRRTQEVLRRLNGKDDWNDNRFIPVLVRSADGKQLRDLGEVVQRIVRSSHVCRGRPRLRQVDRPASRRSFARCGGPRRYLGPRTDLRQPGTARG